MGDTITISLSLLSDCECTVVSHDLANWSITFGQMLIIMYRPIYSTVHRPPTFFKYKFGIWWLLFPALVCHWILDQFSDKKWLRLSSISWRAKSNCDSQSLQKNCGKFYNIFGTLLLLLVIVVVVVVLQVVVVIIMTIIIIIMLIIMFLPATCYL